MLKFHGYFSNGAILQRNSIVRVKGYSDAPVKCVLSGGDYCESVFVLPQNGMFEAVFLPVSDTENTFVITANNGEEISVNVRFGDVYITAGQSNMSYSLNATEGWQNWVDRAKKCPISLLNLVEAPFVYTREVLRPAYEQCDFVRDYQWEDGCSSSLPSISAISVQTAVLLAERKGVPIGVVHTAMGGLSVESYIKRETMENDKDLVSFLKDYGRYVSIDEYNQSGDRNYTQLSGVWNEKLAPLKGLPFSGIVWYLGESSALDYNFACKFSVSMRLLLKDLRDEWGDIPFVAIQIAPEYYPYGDKYGYLYINEALSDLQSEYNVFTVPTYDIEPRWLVSDGDTYYHPIHPVNKAPISERVSLALLNERKYYPEISSFEVKGSALVCKVKNLAKPLIKGTFNGFTVAGKDGKYYPARAESVSLDEIAVSSDEVQDPKFFTYAFTQYQDFCNACDCDGTPLLPYRTNRESVCEGYCFTPAFMINGADEVYENCFGWQVGSCRKVKVWRKGEIYDAAKVEILCDKGGLTVKSSPTKEDYGFFGVSPAVCLSGHRNHFSDYPYLSLKLCAKGNVQFYGIIVRACDGDVYRLDLFNGKEKAEFIQLTSNEKRVSVSLISGLREDSAPIEFTEELRKSFVSVEFLFRSFEAAEVRLKDVEFASTVRSEAFEVSEVKVSRGDINIQDMS